MERQPQSISGGSPFQALSCWRSVSYDAVSERREPQTVLANYVQRDALGELDLPFGLREKLQVRNGHACRRNLGRLKGHASMTCCAGSSLRIPTLAIRPSTIPTSARTHGLPVPSINWPLRMRTSNAMLRSQRLPARG